MLGETKDSIFKGDCLSILPMIESGSADLIYLDPPFFTGKVHRLSPRSRTRQFSFSDIWKSRDEYMDFLHTRLKELHRVLSPRGSLFFHCNYSSAHLARLLLDDVFTHELFRSEIVWHYRRWSNKENALLPSHQTIFYYTKSSEYTFNPIWMDYSPSTNVDQILQRRARDIYNKVVYQRDDKGNVVSNGDKRGVPLSDVWDIPYLNPKARERTGYPTQKPLLLLERIIEIASNAGDVVLDPFCGSGTTLVAAKLLGRHAIGIDIDEDAIEITRLRLINPVKSASNLLTKGRDAYRNADETALSYLQGLDYVPVQRNSGIDAILKHDTNKNPVPVRVQREGETILEAARKLYKAAQNKNVSTMFLVATTPGGYMALASDLPEGVVVVEIPALSIRQHLANATDMSSPQ